MKVDVEKARQDTYDLCIVGTGPAGIILALEYQKLQPHHRVLLIEYGVDGTPPRNPLDDSINIVEPRNHHLPYECTNKGLGGSSASWGGRCVMYDEIDFKPRKILDGQCTWNSPLLHEARRYADRAAEYFHCGEGKFNLAEIPGLASSRIAEHFQNGDVTDSVIERWSLPTRFGKSYRSQIEASPAIHLLTGWEASTLGTRPEDGAVSEVGIRDLARTRREKIIARKIVLAAGAQESTRLLLKNRQLFKNQGSPPPALGKYYQGHISGKIASVRFHGDPKKTEYGFLRSPDGVYLRRRLQLSTQALLENNLLNTALWLDNPLYSDPAHRNGAMSFMYLAMITPGLGKRLAPPAIAQAFTKGKSSGISPHIKNILKDLPGSLTMPAAIFYSRYCMKRKLPGVFLYSQRNVYALHFHAEQVPVPENRMELAEDGETLNIHYKYTGQDIDSVIRTHEFLDRWLRQCKCGALEYWFPKNELPAAIQSISKDGLHQVGTTRISATADEGVVDDDLKVWGVPNLHVCSSSVFPTSGQANPTFLLGAFAVRLAHHLSAQSRR
ncbi:MAG: GMC oxidoreductase [Verrucomicrobiae bacterium]|nr:GMC oxidoreductase [Verrucomicrobiae bacterium]